ncbi:dihydrodipicolinate synthase family protein [Amycolatopsis sp. CA-230715]|uniref:dihydrodipicolinate synthase family protein n=1 Tax=Amycolatopsis sp. CA-230715 TaxID=2745196 RepID=UPI001C03894A|nr:dihydrodipicolinate synthase family protein [Amycolatopsis sp. CA-230715]QWF77413.1 4-hydroxy-tetrahydrodipicolinate synthase [Amycolatopsis sp. CA-230715]
MDSELHGVIPPLVTPIGDDGDVDRHSLEKLVAFQLDAGVHGVFLGGSTGEVALLDGERQRAALDVAVGVVAGAVPVLAGAIDTGTLRVVEQAKRAQETGADAVVVTSPFYVRPHPAEIVAHFQAVHAAIDVPIVAYDIPSATAVPVGAEVVCELAASGTVVAAKDSSGDFAGFRRILREAPGFPAFTGSELFADSAVALGAAGIVPGLGNIDPHGYVRLYEAAKSGDRTAAAAEQDRLARLFDITAVADRGRIGHTAGALGSFKAALAARGVIANATTLPPLAPLNDTELSAILAILDEVGLA